MRAFAFVWISVALCAPADAAPVRAASLNLCTDELLLMLADPAQIASVTHLSHDPAETPLWRRARRYRANDGSLLSVVAQRPSLVVTMGGGGRDRARIARRLGISVIDLPFPRTLRDIQGAIGTVARALGRPAAGQRLIGAIAALERTSPAPATDAVWLGGGGRSVASTGLAAEWMRLAGYRQRSLPGDRIGLEDLLLRPPMVLLRSDYRAGQYSGQQRWLGHPLVRATRGSRMVATDGRRWTCLGPLLIDEVARLRRAAPR